MAYVENGKNTRGVKKESRKRKREKDEKLGEFLNDIPSYKRNQSRAAYVATKVEGSRIDELYRLLTVVYKVIYFKTRRKKQRDASDASETIERILERHLS